MNSDVLKKTLIVMFEMFEKEQKKELFIAYFNELKQYDMPVVVKQINKLIRTSKFFPRIAEILEPFNNDVSEIEIENAWIFFKANMCNNLHFKPIPDWVYTIKRALGCSICENMTNHEEPFRKRDFIRLYPMQKKGELRLLEDPRKDDYIALPNGGSMLPKQSSFAHLNVPEHIRDEVKRLTQKVAVN